LLLTVPLIPKARGEQNVRAQSAGGGAVDIVVSQNVETNLSKLNFSLYPTEENIAIARDLKSKPGENVFQVIDGNFSRTITNATVINDYDVNLGADTTIDLEIMGSAAV